MIFIQTLIQIFKKIFFSSYHYCIVGIPATFGDVGDIKPLAPNITGDIKPIVPIVYDNTMVK